MYRTCANPFALSLALAALAGLTACSSAPPLPEKQSEAIPDSALAKSKPEAKASTPAKSAKTEANASATAPVEPAIPQAAVQQFEDAVALMGSGNTADAEQAFRSLSTAYPTYS